MEFSSYILIHFVIHNRILQYNDGSTSYKYTCCSNEEFEHDNEINMKSSNILENSTISNSIHESGVLEVSAKWNIQGVETPTLQVLIYMQDYPKITNEYQINKQKK